MSPGVHLEGTARIADRTLFGPLKIELPPAAWTCLLGASGVGKSTVLRLLADLPTGVAFDGRIAASDGRPLTGRVAYMAQSDLLLPWRDLLGNVALGASLRGEPPDLDRARALIARVGLADRLSSRPSALSGGERQRAALARTLMEDRPVVLLDEPFSALDARTRAEMQELAAELLAGRTVLLVTHDPAEAARLGQSILLMTPSGVLLAEAPAGDPARPWDAPETLAAQARLLALLRAA